MSKRTSTVSFFLVVMALLNIASIGLSESMPVSSSKEVSYQIPSGWFYKLDGNDVEISTKGVNLQFTKLPLKQKKGSSISEIADNLITVLAKDIVSQSVQQKITLVHPEDLAGGYASFTDASLVGKELAEGQYRELTIGVVCFGAYVFNFTLLTNEIDTELFNQAISIMKSFDYHAVTSGPTIVIIPGQNWNISFQSPQFIKVSNEQTKGGYAYRASAKNGFNMSIFVESKLGEGMGNKACADYYWPQASRNPMIDQKSVVMKTEKDFILVSYNLSAEYQKVKYEIPNINLYFEYKDKWVDIHISSFPGGESGQKVLDAFVKTVKYETMDQAIVPATASEKQEKK